MKTVRLKKRLGTREIERLTLSLRLALDTLDKAAAQAGLTTPACSLIGRARGHILFGWNHELIEEVDE